MNTTHEIYRQQAEDVFPVMPTNFMSARFLLNGVSYRESRLRLISLREKKAFLEANVVLSVYNCIKEPQILTWLRNSPFGNF